MIKASTYLFIPDFKGIYLCTIISLDTSQTKICFRIQRQHMSHQNYLFIWKISNRILKNNSTGFLFLNFGSFLILILRYLILSQFIFVDYRWFIIFLNKIEYTLLLKSLQLLNLFLLFFLMFLDSLIVGMLLIINSLKVLGSCYFDLLIFLNAFKKSFDFILVGGCLLDGYVFV